METKKFYQKCGSMLKDVKEKKTGIKTACYKTQMPGKYMAVLSNILRRYSVLEKVVNVLGDKIRCKYASIVLCYEILYGCRRENMKFNKKLVKEVKDAYASLGIEEKKIEREKEVAYLRLNTLKADRSMVSTLMLEETIIPDVYKVLEKVNWSKLKSYNEGCFFIQDLSSCMAAHVLSPPKNSVVIDACASPGNKTTHLSMVMENTGTIFAVEKDVERFKTLREMVEKSGAENITTIHGNFLQVSETNSGEILAATHILVDPSCSGSGLHPEEEKDQQRIKSLVNFQIQILDKAMGLPNAKKVVYTTCSLYEEENEHVVLECLKKHPQFEVVEALPQWRKRGVPGYAFSDLVVRCDAETETRGFFLACLRRKSSER